MAGANSVGGQLQLTNGGSFEAASAFSTSRIDVSDFTTNFSFQITPGTNPTADGFTFCIQAIGPTALGSSGGYLGYGGISQSVAIKFDLYNNAGEGPDSTGIFFNGASPFVPATDLSLSDINLHSGDVFEVAMTYDGTTLNVTITDTITEASASQSYTVNIPSYVGGSYAYVGFTGATGGLTAVQTINNWTFTPLPEGTSEGNVVAGNLIGTDVSGMLPLGNDTGVLMTAGAVGNTLGGTFAGSGNIISGNLESGVISKQSALLTTPWKAMTSGPCLVLLAPSPIQPACSSEEVPPTTPSAPSMSSIPTVPSRFSLAISYRGTRTAGCISTASASMTPRSTPRRT